MVPEGSENHLTAPKWKTSFRPECKRMSGRPTGRPTGRATPLPLCARSGIGRPEEPGKRGFAQEEKKAFEVQGFPAARIEAERPFRVNR